MKKDNKSGVDLDNSLLFKKFEEFKTPFKTSAVNLGDFIKEADEALENHDTIIVITISKFLSSTYRNLSHFVNNNEVYTGRVIVYDSTLLTPWIQFIYDDLLEMVEYENITLEKIFSFIDYYRDGQKGYIVPDNLERLKIGGRISEFQYKLATTLKIFPILEIINGDLAGAKVIKVRKKSKIPSKLADLVIESYKELENEDPNNIKILYVNNDNDLPANEMIKIIKSKGYEIHSETVLAPEINAHVGSKAIGAGAIRIKNWREFV